MHFRVAGRGLTEAVVERAVRLSHEKYCSASAMLGKTAEMTTSFEIAAA
jgi:putative redox protein